MCGDQSCQAVARQAVSNRLGAEATGNPPSAPEGITDMLHRTVLVRTMFCALGASTLVLGGTTAPASATGDHDHHNDEVKVLVCVHIDDGDDEEVDITVSTDKEDDDATLEDGDCERFRLEFDRNRVDVEAHTRDDVRFRVFGDDEGFWSDDGDLTVRFDDDEDNPFVGVSVRVEDDHHHHHHHG